MRLTASPHVFTAAAILASAALLHAQSAPANTPPPEPQPCTASPQPAPCTATPSKPADKGSATDRFPFPGETPTPADTPKTLSPTTPAQPPDAPAEPSGSRFPFPGEDTAPATPQPKPSTGSSSSSSADPTAFPADDTNSPDPNAPVDKAAKPEGRRLLKRVNPIGTKLQSNDEREAEDLNVAHFYTQTGNLQGAYLRAEDAVKIMPDDPDAHCSLAEAALKINKRDEAIAQFNACLKLDPEEKEAKNARKELAKLK